LKSLFFIDLNKESKTPPEFKTVFDIEFKEASYFEVSPSELIFY
jgi:hypothetical protein